MKARQPCRGGAVEFDEVDAGSYTVKVWASKGGEICGVGKNSVEVSAGESAPCEIKMRTAYSASAAASYIQGLDGGDVYKVIVAGPADDNAIAGIKAALAKNNMNGTVALDLSWTTGLTEIAGLENNGAFEDCARLSSVVLPEGMTAIGKRAFFCCEALKNVVIPYGVTEIKENAFWYCESLASVEIPNSVTTLGKSAFTGCSALDLKIPESVKRIGDGALKITGISSIDLEKVTYDFVSFEGCSKLLNITIPASETRIYNRAFLSCESLETVTILGDLTDVDEQNLAIGRVAFSGCENLQTITFRGKITGTIGDNAFLNCSALTTVNYGGSQDSWSNIDFGTGNELLKNAAKIICSDGTITNP